ncbi:sugar ABC transporter ATP-binding protein [Pelomonas sp. V22]|uniref:sugar ABC transporter ATP-binding protein n=1 Tax=Pelomonas sp. V22 TaxID=2822139 RepID=UPI0024A7C179|nr:sugar ABC transporter ATP-binding protein [Pelomonas sp. V22]MDI4632953.1 sugar ABC transporter ATP-binding protein [Pelomonas sp. V22]
MKTLAFHAIAKSFGPVTVLHGVSFELQAGIAVGLLGENGAGKSTLMKILAGYETPSSGELRLDGEALRFDGPRAAEAAGIAMIHQEFALAEALTVAQNIFLGHELRRGWRLDDAAMHAATTQLLAQVGLACPPDRPVRLLSLAEKQRVEIAKALQRRARVLVMDEPTATLTPAEAEALFALMGRLKAEGVTLIYISHKLEEIERLTDEVVVMRDGRFISRTPTASLTRAQMAQAMVGRELSELYPTKTTRPTAEPLLKVQKLSVPGWVEDLSFEVAPGEILGFAGLVGAGRTELFEGLMGLRASRAERVEIAGKAVRIRNPREAVELGLGYLSEDRKGKGLHLDFSLAANLTLMALRRYAKPWLKPADEAAALARAVEEFGIRVGSSSVRGGSLSGGNQQKLALAKVLHAGPRIVVLDEPTRGVDVGAKRELYLLIQQLAAQGLAVIVVSSELVELIGLCHRIAVLRAGRLQTVLDADGVSEDLLIAHATGTH